jgi:hypothetical protein
VEAIVIAAAASGARREVARYSYTDREGNVLYEVVRFLLPDGGKTFLQCRLSGVEAAGTGALPKGGTVWGLNSGFYVRRNSAPVWTGADADTPGAVKCAECLRVPYRLSKVIRSDTVYLVEGEKDVDTLEAWGLTATCNPGGSGNSRLYAGWTEDFRGRRLIVLLDNDGPGRQHAATVATTLLPVAASLRITELPGLPEAGDVTDWRDAGGTLEQFHKLVEATSPTDEAGLTDLRKRWGLESGEQSPRVHVSSPGEWSESTRVNWPQELREEAFHGVAGRLVRAIEPHSEADTAAVLIQFLIAFGNLVGRSAYFVAEADRHYMNLFGTLVGRTAKGRKGTSMGQVVRVLGAIDEDWLRGRVMGGLASGEGLIWAVRDEIRGNEPIKEKGRTVGHEEVVKDPGVTDKRLLVHEPEFARVLQVAERESSTLSAIVRQAWDTGNLRILTKTQPAKSTNAHISIIGHITKDELRRLLTDTAAGNGFANRFLWGCVRRSKLLPEGGALHTVDFAPIIRQIQDAAYFARSVREIKRDDRARAIWRGVYPALSEGKPGLLGAVTSRAEAQTMRLACLFALLDCSFTIKAEHLLAALEVWRYCEDSARFIFGDALGDATADEIIRELRQHPEGMSRNDIREHFQRNKPSAEIGRALGVLLECTLARVERTREDDAQKRPTERWFAL